MINEQKQCKDSVFVEIVMQLKKAHIYTWRERDDLDWYLGLSEELNELLAALYDKHSDTPDHELTQIAAICLNWLEKRDCNIDELRKSLSRHVEL